MLNNLKILAVGCGLLVLSGCASVPSQKRMQDEIAGFQLPKLPEPDKAIVYVVRPSIIGTLIRFNIFVDDKKLESNIGYTKGREYIYFNLPPGSHRILSKAENWDTIDITAKAGDVIFLQQDPKMGLVLARNSIKLIDEYEGRYNVKRLSLGKIKKLDK